MENTVNLQVGVKAILKNKEGRYLLLRRSVEKYPDVIGRWDIAGGRIDAGTNLLQNLQREVQEETGLQISGTPSLIAAQDIIRPPKQHVVRLTYSAHADGEVLLDLTENDEFHWFTWEELIHLDDMSIYFKQLLTERKQLPLQ